MSLGVVLKNARKTKGLSQDELAAKLRVTRGAVSQWETDKSVPSYEHATLLVEYLDLHPTAISPLIAIELAAESNHRPVPLLTLDQIDLAWGASGGEDPLKHVLDPGKCWVSRDVAKDAVAVLLTDDSMAPKFRKGDIVVIDMWALFPRDEDYVVARPCASAGAMLRQCVLRGKDTKGRQVFDLKAINPELSTVTVSMDLSSEIPSEYTCIGIVIEHRYRLLTDSDRKARADVDNR